MRDNAGSSPALIDSHTEEHTMKSHIRIVKAQRDVGPCGGCTNQIETGEVFIEGVDDNMLCLECADAVSKIMVRRKWTKANIAGRISR